MSLKLEINPPLASSGWVDMTQYLIQDTWYIQEEWGRQGATAYFEITDEYGSSTIHQSAVTVPGSKALSQIRLTDPAKNATLFQGLMANPAMVWEGAQKQTFRLNCRDYTYYADSRLVTASFKQQTMGSIATQLVDTSNTGLTIDPNVPDGPVISSIQFDHVPLSDALDQLCQLASWQADFGFWVDYNQVVHIADEATSRSSGVTVYDDAITGGGVLDASHAFIDLGQQFLYEYDGTQLRNTVTVRGASKTQNQTDKWGGDGQTTQWPLSYDVDTSSPITLHVAGVAKTVSVSTDPNTATTDFCLIQSAIGQWFLTPAVASTPTSGQLIQLDYTAQVPVQAVYQNGESVSQYGGPNGGIFEEFVQDDTLKDASAAYSRARSEVQQFGLAQERITFSIMESWPGYIRTGDWFTLNSIWLWNARGPYVVGFNDQYLVQRLTLAGTQANRRRYDIVGVRFVVV